MAELLRWVERMSQRQRVAVKSGLACAVNWRENLRNERPSRGHVYNRAWSPVFQHQWDQKMIEMNRRCEQSIDFGLPFGPRSVVRSQSNATLNACVVDDNVEIRKL
jgi:hypothetical protein